SRSISGKLVMIMAWMEAAARTGAQSALLWQDVGSFWVTLPTAPEPPALPAVPENPTRRATPKRFRFCRRGLAGWPAQGVTGPAGDLLRRQCSSCGEAPGRRGRLCPLAGVACEAGSEASQEECATTLRNAGALYRSVIAEHRASLPHAFARVSDERAGL